MDWKQFISQYDLVYETPPSCWQDGFLLGNGSLGAIFYAREALEWVVNKTDVLDGRTRSVKHIIPRGEAEEMVRNGATCEDFAHLEQGKQESVGMGPKTCCQLTMNLAIGSANGQPTALPSLNSRLGLYDATLRVDVDKYLCHPKVESFVSADEDILTIRVRDVSSMVGFYHRLFFSRPYDIELPEPILCEEKGRLVMRMSMPESSDYVVGLQVVARPTTCYRNDLLKKLREQYRPPVTGNVKVETVGRYGIIDVGGDFDVFLTVVTSRDCEDYVAEMHARLDRVIKSSYAQIRQAHTEHWQKYWHKSWVELGNKALEQLFYHSLYVLGSTYRRGPVAGLCGLAYGPVAGPFQMSPWTGDLHHDLNIQCPFLPVHALNHSELFDAYLDSYESFLPYARKLAFDVYGVEGAHFDMACNVNGKSMFGGIGRYRYFFGGSYVAFMHCICWRYRRDVQQLENVIYPFLKEVLQFYLNIMQKGDDGLYHLWPAHAAELNVMNCGDPVQTISMLRVCLETAIEASEILKTDEVLVDEWSELLANLPEYPVGRDDKGRDIVVDGVGIHPDHHVGQAGCLYPVYPCGEVDGSSPEEVLLLYQRTLDSVVDKTAETSYANDRSYHYKCVWQCFFRAMTALRLGHIDQLWQLYMPMFLRTYCKPNGLLSHDATLITSSVKSEANIANIPDEALIDVDEKMPKFEAWYNANGQTSPNPRAKELSVPLVEANADYLTMITETLLQSHKGVIRVFPGWPKGRDGQFVNLVAEGNVAVSSKIVSDEVVFIKLKSKRSEKIDVSVKLPWTGDVKAVQLQGGDQVLLTKDDLPQGDAAQSPEAIEQAQPRKIYEDNNGCLWLGRKE